MGNNDNSLRTPLSRVRGHGASGTGTGHFIGQRVSAILLGLLTPVLIVVTALGLQPGYDAARAFVGQPWVAGGIILFIVLSLYHMQLGMNVIVEDYIHKPVNRALLLLLNTTVTIALGAIGVFSVLMINFGG